VALKKVGSAGAEFGPVGYELNLLYIAALLALALSPPTALSLERLFIRAKGRVGGASEAAPREVDRLGRIDDNPIRATEHDRDMDGAADRSSREAHEADREVTS
jgi:hypothetical protein